GSGYAVLLQFEGRLSRKNRSAAWDTLRGHAQGNPMSACSASLSLTRCGLWRLPIRSPHSGVMRPELAPASIRSRALRIVPRACVELCGKIRLVGNYRPELPIASGNPLHQHVPQSQIRRSTTPGPALRRITIGPDDMIWYTDFARGFLGR